MHGHAGRSAVEALQHIVKSGLDVVAGVHDRPADADVLRGVVGVHTKAQGGLVEGVSLFLGLLGALEPCLVRSVELLLDNRDVISALRAITVRKYPGHFQL